MVERKLQLLIQSRQFAISYSRVRKTGVQCPLEFLLKFEAIFRSTLNYKEPDFSRHFNTSGGLLSAVFTSL